MFKVISGVVGGLVLLVGLGWTIAGNQLAMFQVFSPAYEAVRRDTMLQSRAYSEATVRELYRFKLQYQQARTDDERNTVKQMALHEFQIFEKNRLPVELQVFMTQLEN